MYTPNWGTLGLVRQEKGVDILFCFFSFRKVFPVPLRRPTPIGLPHALTKKPVLESVSEIAKLLMESGVGESNGDDDEGYVAGKSNSEGGSEH